MTREHFKGHPRRQARRQRALDLVLGRQGHWALTAEKLGGGVIIDEKGREIDPEKKFDQAALEEANLAAKGVHRGQA